MPSQAENSVLSWPQMSQRYVAGIGDRKVSETSRLASRDRDSPVMASLGREAVA